MSKETKRKKEIAEMIATLLDVKDDIEMGEIDEETTQMIDEVISKLEKMQEEK